MYAREVFWLAATMGCAALHVAIVFYEHFLKPHRYWNDIYGALKEFYFSYEDGSKTLRYSDSKMRLTLYPDGKITAELLNCPAAGQATLVLSLYYERTEIYQPQGEEQWEKYLLKTLLPKIEREERVPEHVRRELNKAY